MLRKAGHDEINILVRGRSATPSGQPPERELVRAAAVPAPERDREPDAEAPMVRRGALCLPAPKRLRIGGCEEAALREQIHPEDAAVVRQEVAAAAAYGKINQS
jgi:hypothetical protein